MTKQISSKELRATGSSNYFKKPYATIRRRRVGKNNWRHAMAGGYVEHVKSANININRHPVESKYKQTTFSKVYLLLFFINGQEINPMKSGDN